MQRYTFLIVLLLSSLSFAQGIGGKAGVGGKAGFGGGVSAGGQTPSQVGTAPTIGECSGGTCTATTGAVDTSTATLLVIQVNSYNVGPSVVGDSQGNTYTPATLYTRTASTDNIQFYYACGPVNNAAMTFHATGGYLTVIASAWKGTKATACFDKEAGNITCAGVITCQLPSTTPSQANSLLLTGISLNSANVWTPDGGFTVGTNMQDNNGSIQAGTMSYLVQGAAVAASPTWSGTVTSMAASLIVFKPGP